MPTPQEVGQFIDNVSSKEDVPRRTPSAVAGRFIEEAVELCLAAGLSPVDIMGHIMDAIHNQASKAGKARGRVIYPSYYLEDYEAANVAEELADCFLVLKDLAFITETDMESAQNDKWAKFIQRDFYVSDSGTLYAIK